MLNLQKISNKHLTFLGIDNIYNFERNTYSSKQFQNLIRKLSIIRVTFQNISIMNWLKTINYQLKNIKSLSIKKTNKNSKELIKRKLKHRN